MNRILKNEFEQMQRPAITQRLHIVTASVLTNDTQMHVAQRHLLLGYSGVT